MTREMRPDSGGERAVVDGITYHYPPDSVRLTAAEIEAMCRLSASHAVDDIALLEADSETFPAQGAYCVESPAPDADTMTGLGEVIRPGYGRFIEAMLDDPDKRARLERIGEKLEAGRNIAHAIFHGPLLDDGLSHGAMTVGLKVLGYDFRTAIVVSGGTTGLGINMEGGDIPPGTVMPVTAALKTGTDKVWHTIPRTENARASEFGRTVPSGQIKKLNDITVDGITADLEAGGWLFTILPDGSTHRRGPEGEYQLFNPGQRTLEIMASANTYVQAAGGRFLGREESLYGLFGGLRRFSRFSRIRMLQGDAMMLDMAAGATQLVEDETFVADPPKRAGSFAVDLFRQVG